MYLVLPDIPELQGNKAFGSAPLSPRISNLVAGATAIAHHVN